MKSGALKNQAKRSNAPSRKRPNQYTRIMSLGKPVLLCQSSRTDMVVIKQKQVRCEGSAAFVARTNRRALSPMILFRYASNHLMLLS